MSNIWLLKCKFRHLNATFRHLKCQNYIMKFKIGNLGILCVKRPALIIYEIGSGGRASNLLLRFLPEVVTGTPFYVNFTYHLHLNTCISTVIQKQNNKINRCLGCCSGLVVFTLDCSTGGLRYESFCFFVFLFVFVLYVFLTPPPLPGVP